MRLHGSQVGFEGIPPTKLSKAFIRNITFKDKAFSVRDTAVNGLMVAVNKNTKSYKVQRDICVGQKGRYRKVKTVRHTLGTTNELTLDDSRTRAMEVIARIKKSIDPNAPPGTYRAETWTSVNISILESHMILETSNSSGVDLPEGV